MKKKELKAALNAELTAEGFNTKIHTIAGTGTGPTVLAFKNTPGPLLQKWLNKRFKYGVSIDAEAPHIITINPPTRAPRAEIVTDYFNPAAFEQTK